MPGALWCTFYKKITDANKLAAYAALAVPALAAGGGKFVARGLPSAVFEAGLQERTVIISFSSVEAALSCYNSPAYKEALSALGDGAERDLRIVPTIE